MTWEPVPFMIGNGAVHSEAVFRLMAYEALNGNEGVLGPNDLKVSALSPTGGGVQVGVGAAGILGRGPSQLYEMYAARMPILDAVPIAATGSGAGRSDLIIARIEDPNIAGSQWNQPADTKVGPYVFTRLISGVPANTRTVTELNLGYSAIPLARIDVPVSTSSITQAMIVDLRKVANPRRDRRVYTVNPSGSIPLSSASVADWFGSWTVDLPAWATRAVVVVNVGGVRHARNSSSSNGTANGQVRAALGTLFTQSSKYDVETSYTNNVGRYTFGTADTVAIPSLLRGTTQTLRIQGSREGGNQPVSVTDSSFATVDVEFQESPV